MKRLLPGLLTGLYSAMVFAQTSVDIAIEGVDGRVKENVQLYLGIVQQKDHPLMSEGRLRRLHKKAPREIGLALQPFGYYRPTIEPELTRLGDDQWRASYAIDAGPPVPVGVFDFEVSGEMEQDPELRQLLLDTPLRAGATFNHLQYEDLKTSLAKLASERGYFAARFIERGVEVDLESYTARVRLHYDSGPRYAFGDVSLDQDALDDDLLRAYIPFETGSPYDLGELLDLQQALNDSDYFRSVEVSPGQPRAESLEVPVEVALTPRKRHRYSFGLGYGTDTGPRTRFGWDVPRLNKAGHRVGTEVRLSSIGYQLGVNYRVPVLNPRTDQLVYSAGVVNETTDTSESTVRSIGASLNRGRGAWRESLSLNYQQEDFRIADSAGESVLLLPGISWSRIWGDDFINTLDGLRFDLSLRGASEQLVSDTDFIQLLGGIKAIYSLDQRNRIVTRGRVGSTRTDNFDRLPSSVRFFAGGAQSVRGYAYQSLGPVDANGEVIGGKHLLIGSIEFERLIGERWGIALFYDAGNAVDDFAESLERGSGFGLRWKSPVGPVRIDIANALSEQGNPWRLHINIGPDL